MIIAMIDGHTRVCGKSQGYLGLPVRDILMNDKVNGITPAMETAWTPTPEELARLNAGANVILRILGSTPPPQMIEVGPVPDPIAMLEPDRCYCQTQFERSHCAYCDEKNECKKGKPYPENCPGHVASPSNPKLCLYCGIHIDSLRPPD